jgi:hypothetical protein
MKFGSFILLLFIASRSFSQTYATTEDGKRVLLNDDSTWRYLADSSTEKTDTTSKRTVIRPLSAQTLQPSERNKFGIWYNNTKWKVSSQKVNPIAEFTFINTGKFPEAYCMVITERVQLGLDILKKQVISNSRQNVENYKLVREEYLTVNQHKVLHMIFTGTVQGIEAEYDAYYSTDGSGVIQVVCFTSSNLFASYEKEFNDILNGLVIR